MNQMLVDSHTLESLDVSDPISATMMMFISTNSGNEQTLPKW